MLFGPVRVSTAIRSARKRTPRRRNRSARNRCSRQKTSQRGCARRDTGRGRDLTETSRRNSGRSQAAVEEKQRSRRNSARAPKAQSTSEAKRPFSEASPLSATFLARRLRPTPRRRVARIGSWDGGRVARMEGRRQPRRYVQNIGRLCNCLSNCI